jgi:hypothetical protein
MNLHFDTDVARTHGLEKAVVIARVRELIGQQQAKGILPASYPRTDGLPRHWVTLSADDLEQQFPFWTGRYCQLLVRQLCDEGVLVKGRWGVSPGSRCNQIAFVNERETVGGV